MEQKQASYTLKNRGSNDKKAFIANTILRHVAVTEIVSYFYPDPSICGCVAFWKPASVSL